MLTRLIRRMAAVAFLLSSPVCLAEQVIFEDDFDHGLSSKWQAVGLKKEDNRIRDGGLELRVQPGKLTRDTPMLKVALPFTASDSVVASVEVTVINAFTQPKEFAGLFLVDKDGRDFGAKKQFIDGKLVFSPGKYTFKGELGEEGDPNKYTVKYSPVNKAAGPIRILVRGSTAFFQVGPSTKDQYQNFFHSAIVTETKERGFCLTASGAPQDAVHWVRFDNFRVSK